MRRIYLGMKLVSQAAKLIDLVVPFGPDGDGAPHVAHAPESAEKHGHALHVFGAVTSLNEPLIDKPHVGRRALQLQPGQFVAEGNGNFRQIVLVVFFGVSDGVLGQAKRGTFLALGPKAFAAYISADTGENLGAEDAEVENAENDHHECSDNGE